jgi:hypothetical protein
MERWSYKYKELKENKDIDVFLEEIIGVYKKHGLSIGHEDYHGGFKIHNFNESNADWILSAMDATEDD